MTPNDIAALKALVDAIAVHRKRTQAGDPSPLRELAWNAISMRACEAEAALSRLLEAQAGWVSGCEPNTYGEFWVFIDPKDGGSTMIRQARYLPSGDGTGHWAGIPCIPQFITYHMQLLEPHPPSEGQHE